MTLNSSTTRELINNAQIFKPEESIKITIPSSIKHSNERSSDAAKQSNKEESKNVAVRRKKLVLNRVD